MLTLGTNTAIVSSLGFINLKGRLAHVTRRLVYLLLRMPTRKHRFQVGKYWLVRLFHGITNQDLHNNHSKLNNTKVKQHKSKPKSL
ncbi:MAG TPA: hypothetical protein VE944_09230 [Nostoc sp.]|uniref:hypothetical protein n=1 Tax=Nostoc sp. TaxID=1180 RepID=UPI002D458E54|nr:hypothetical protein [Nostoc sp.]HYX14536.1 hypothetical protein [Nostoc sp.]